MPFVAVKAARSRLTLVRQSTTVPNTSKIQALIAVIMVPEMHPCDRHEADLTLRMDRRHFVGKLAYRFHRNILWGEGVLRIRRRANPSPIYNQLGSLPHKFAIGPRTALMAHLHQIRRFFGETHHLPGVGQTGRDGEQQSAKLIDEGHNTTREERSAWISGSYVRSPLLPKPDRWVRPRTGFALRNPRCPARFGCWKRTLDFHSSTGTAAGCRSPKRARSFLSGFPA